VSETFTEEAAGPRSGPWVRGSVGPLVGSGRLNSACPRGNLLYRPSRGHPLLLLLKSMLRLAAGRSLGAPAKLAVKPEALQRTLSAASLSMLAAPRHGGVVIAG